MQRKRGNKQGLAASPRTPTPCHPWGLGRCCQACWAFNTWLLWLLAGPLAFPYSHKPPKSKVPAYARRRGFLARHEEVAWPLGTKRPASAGSGSRGAGAGSAGSGAWAGASGAEVGASGAGAGVGASGALATALAAALARAGAPAPVPAAP